MVVVCSLFGKGIFCVKPTKKQGGKINELSCAVQMGGKMKLLLQAGL